MLVLKSNVWRDSTGLFLA